jgi:hypothetical protein
MPVANDVVGKKKTLSLLDHFPVNHIVEPDVNDSQKRHYTREFVMRLKNEKNIYWQNKPNKQTRTNIKAKLWEQFNKALAINVETASDAEKQFMKEQLDACFHTIDEILFFNNNNDLSILNTRCDICACVRGDHRHAIACRLSDKEVSLQVHY